MTCLPLGIQKLTACCDDDDDNDNDGNTNNIHENGLEKAWKLLTVHVMMLTEELVR